MNTYQASASNDHHLSARLLRRITPPQFDPQPVSEGGQAGLRLISVAIFILLLWLSKLLGFGAMTDALWPIAALYISFAYIWIFVISYDLIHAQKRKWLTIFLEFSMFGLGFHFGGAATSWLISAPVFSASGYALRFGRQHLQLALLIGFPIVATGLFTQPYWIEHADVAIGLLLTLLIVPTYVFNLSEQVMESKRRLELHAQQLHVETRMDGLTGLQNRVGFSEKIGQQFSDPQKSAILYLDLDGFKNVNDTAGHLLGDQALRDAARLIVGCLRIGDVVARLGGDEFVVSLRGLSKHEDANQIANNIINAIEKIRIEGFEDLRLGVSIGICLLPRADIHNLDELLRRADTLMYQAKRSGKNRYIAG